MRKKAKSAANQNYLKLPQAKILGAFKKPPFSLWSILPQLLLIAACVGFYYLMIHFYLFFTWGFYIYYALKLVVACAILSASRRTLLLPLCALLLGLAVLLFTNNLFLNTLMNSDTAWQLLVVGLAGILIALFKGKKHA